MSQLVLVLILIGFKSGVIFISQSQAVAMQNQSNRDIIFETQLKTAPDSEDIDAEVTSSSVSPSFSIPRSVAALKSARSAMQVSNPMLCVNSLQKMPVALKSLKTFFHSSRSGYSSKTLPVVRWLFLLQCGRALYFVNSLSSMVLWYSLIPNAPGRKGICK